ncbi:MAG: hypothetical protein ACREX8_20960, partial [Gammaproteobacteria bacterium]
TRAADLPSCRRSWEYSRQRDVEGNRLAARDGVNLEAPTLQGAVMPSILSKIRRFLSSPQGRRAIDQGRRYASNPRNRAKLRGLLSRRRRY